MPRLVPESNHAEPTQLISESRCGRADPLPPPRGVHRREAQNETSGRDFNQTRPDTTTILFDCRPARPTRPTPHPPTLRVMEMGTSHRAARPGHSVGATTNHSEYVARTKFQTNTMAPREDEPLWARVTVKGWGERRRTRSLDHVRGTVSDGRMDRVLVGWLGNRLLSNFLGCCRCHWTLHWLFSVRSSTTFPAVSGSLVQCSRTCRLQAKDNSATPMH